MNPILLGWITKLIAGLGLIVVLGVAYAFWAAHERGIGDARTAAIYDKAIVQQKLDASKLLAMETAKVAGAERALQDSKNQRELVDAKNKTTVADLSDKLRNLTDSAGRLRDPNATGCRGSGSSAAAETAAGAGDRADDTAEDTGLLSRELSDLLLTRAKEADEINNAYASCRADALNIRTMQPVFATGEH